MRPTLPRLLLAAAFLAAGAATWYLPARAQQATPAPSPAPGSSDSPANDEAPQTPPPIPSPKPGVDDPKVHKLAVQQFLAWQTASINRDLYSDTVNAQLTDELIDRATKTLANMGALQSANFLGISQTKDGKLSLFVYKMICVNGSVNMDFSLQPDGKIGLIFFV